MGACETACCGNDGNVDCQVQPDMKGQVSTRIWCLHRATILIQELILIEAFQLGQFIGTRGQG